MFLRPGERMDDLGRSGLRIIQHPGRFPFSLDPVLLAHFARIGRRDRVLDLGTGSGVIPLLIAALYPEARVTGLEIQPETAEMAHRSVGLNHLEDRVRIVRGDFRQIGQVLDFESFDVVTLNPPYREPWRGRVSPTHARAVARHELECSLEEAIRAAAAAVKFGGRVATVFLADRLVDLIIQMRQNRLEPKRLRMVHPRQGRPANFVLLESIKGGGTELKVEPPFYVHGHGPAFSPELDAIYDGKNSCSGMTE